jgi:protein O-GlcNAc transferase
MRGKQRRGARVRVTQQDSRTGIATTDLLAAGLEHHQAGRLDEAERLYRQVLSVDACNAYGLHLLGIIAYTRGRLELTVELIGKVITIKPDFPEALSNLGVALKDLGKLDEAIACHEKALAINPNNPVTLSNLGVALKCQSKLDEAITRYEQALAIQPNYPEALANLGNALRDQGKLDEAISRYEQALALKPNYPEVLSNLGVALRDQGKLGEAVARYERALAIKPEYPEALSNLGVALIDQGKLDDAIACYERAIAVKPDYVEAYSNRAFCLNYHDKVTAAEVFSAHCHWHERIARPVSKPMAYANKREIERRLKVGYVSPDFCQHSVAFFIEPLLRAHDRQAVEVFCYADVTRPDAVTERLRGYADHWLMTVGRLDDDLAERIRKDRIDILVDLAGYTLKNRLGVFARKPAPVQVTWMGYPNTTGLDTIDYRLVDAVTDPVGEADAWASETLVRLEGGFLCYGGAEDVPEPTVPPCLMTHTVTFGSFNNPAKLSDATLDTWARLLDRVPKARLLLKGKPLGDAATRVLFLSRLGERGVEAERVELVSWLSSPAMHLALYDRVDIALDPFPYNGTTTTCEALWMGVPVVTLLGDRHAGRVGASLLTQVGFTDWIASSVDEYLEIATELAADPNQLNELRHTLRARLAASTLCDGRAFAHKIEAAYRTMWQHWCGTSGKTQERTARASS